MEKLDPVVPDLTIVPSEHEFLEITPEELAAEALENERGWLERIGVGRRLREMVIDPKIVPKECREWLDQCHEGASMILAGNPGAGKTVSAIYCLRMVYRHRQNSFGSCQYCKARALYRAVFDRDALSLQKARECDVLVIDEWGGAYASEWPLAEIDGLIDDRWEDRLATIITTNQHPTEGPGCIRDTAPRAFDRLCDEPGPGVVLIDRESMRGRLK